MSKFAKIELIIPEDHITDLQEQFGSKLTVKRLVKKATDHSDTRINVSRNLIGGGDTVRRRG